ncbi:patatin-like phospholipase family protein [Clostridium sp. DJ247]|uniref:patatin-like phospholipase family protein n=1 Tax=Clostridium sp. DJ247 TaxID=2726188 RepID=UPI0016262029|nr:patatin-like phospholipase family protein [Clostridium sp. DJ247]MBC2581904.1 patatin [Clostridium sp. DJ247]
MKKYKIMTFDGGGIRGALSSQLLKRLNDFFPKLIENTNLFVGTSTGAFIALGLAYGVSPDKLVDIYIKNAKYIFTPRHEEFTRPRYNNEHLKEVLSSIFPENLTLKDLKRHVIIPSFQLLSTSTLSWNPILFNNFHNSLTLNEKVIDVALSSSAAPVYFPSYQGKIDGGVIANNPSTTALAFSRNKVGGYKYLDEVTLLSIGTGYKSYEISADTTKWGALQWVTYFNPPVPLINILFDGGAEMDSMLTAQFLGDNYYRLNVNLPKSVHLDDYKMIPNLIKLANSFNMDACKNWLEKTWVIPK